MASYTPNLNLILPVGTEKVSRQIINQNNGIIDSAVGNIVAPSVQSVSTLAELKTYLLAVAGSAEARKNVPVQFNLTAAASPFNSGLYTGIMQKETNGAFSVLCHGYNGGVVEVQYASSTWTIMNLTSEITALNGNMQWKNSGSMVTGNDVLTLPTGNWKELYIQFLCRGKPKIAFGLYIGNNPSSENHYTAVGYLSQTEITAAGLSTTPHLLWVDVYVNRTDLLMVEANSEETRANYQMRAWYR